jgi:hypothetical protein
MRPTNRLASFVLITGVAFAAATAVFGQAVTTVPRVNSNTPPATTTIVPSSMCVPDSANSGTCTATPILPPMTPAPAPTLAVKPVAPTPISPRTSLANGSAHDGAAVGDEKVLSYFQRSLTQVDTRKAFGFVLLPRSAVTADETQVQRRFCKIMLASMDFVDADGAARTKALVTYWPVVAAPSPRAILAAFEAGDCAQLIAWYDHKLARAIAARAGVAGLSGPLLITWPSEGRNPKARDPLIVDFAMADHAHATKALQYWFGQLRLKPALWTNRIREGTIRAELAGAINDTAGVVLAVLAGKWDSVTAVSDTP